MVGKFEWDGTTLTHKTEISQDLLKDLRNIFGIDAEKELRKILVAEYEGELNEYCNTILEVVKVYHLKQPPRDTNKFLKDLQAIHGKEEGLKQYNEIMERENGKNISD